MLELRGGQKIFIIRGGRGACHMKGRSENFYFQGEASPIRG